MSSTTNYIKYENKGLSGLSNLGNTCFINTCMQILSHTYELNTFLINKTWQEKISDTKVETLLFLAWDKLRKDMWSDTDLTIHPHDFIDTFIKTAIKKDREDQLNKHSEDKNKWELEKNRLNKQIQTLNQTVNQGTTVDQGSGAEISLGEFLKKIFKDKNDKIQEEYTPKLFSEEQNYEDSQINEIKEDNVSDQLFDQENNEDEDFEIPAFLRRQKF